MMMRRIVTKEIMAAIPRSELMMMRERLLNLETATPRKSQEEKKRNLKSEIDRNRTQKHELFRNFLGLGQSVIRFANVGVKSTCKSKLETCI